MSALGAGVAGFRPAFPVQSSASSPFEPAHHQEDAWFDKIPGKHRFIFDTTTPEGFGGALLYANNFFEANKTGYGLDASDLAVVIVARHMSTPFAYNDMIWSKYGRPLTSTSNFTDPKTKEPPSVNLFNATGYGGSLTNRGTTLDSLLKRGLHLAVCRMATRALAGAIAGSTGGDAGKINDELIANIVMNAHMVPAGIVAVSRAQEHGYTFAHSV